MTAASITRAICRLLDTFLFWDRGKTELYLKSGDDIVDRLPGNNAVLSCQLTRQGDPLHDII